MKKLTKKYAPFLFSGIMAVMMGLVMSLVMTLVNVGTGPRFWIIWLRAFGIGVLAAFPTSLIVAPFSRKLVDSVTARE